VVKSIGVIPKLCSHIAFNLITFSMIILIKILSRDIFMSLVIKEAVESVNANMYTVLPHHIQLNNSF
jgi:hypothetical protein